jgi:hypothetical protein
VGVGRGNHEEAGKYVASENGGHSMFKRGSGRRFLLIIESSCSVAKKLLTKGNWLGIIINNQLPNIREEVKNAIS